ncbi:LuxR C-terminal-related transcriptional regulator [Vibrio sp. CK2-1]|uniref:LuxR C-terminal-related transcriptional regulator n=1 Tax=Vibrio sp. CK2-1 TaxID=2912249 RepID=UPI001EFF64DC|nr:LuxR C-terminal-related transcriptional regulator [Vibrio sp. CK2-1]MCF7353295.1 LuxR C-terminal-related transcriptional regulator [Vibrio sp. CK2-1]
MDEKLYLITSKTLQSSLLKENLERELERKIEPVTFNNFLEFIDTCNIKPVHVILDMEYIQGDMIKVYLNQMHEEGRKAKEILINNNRDISVSFVLQFPNVVAVFFKDDSLDNITKGLTDVLSGRFSLSNELSQKIIEYYRENDLFSSRAFADLTCREEEILKLLLVGASNIQIAEQLFVSENTVKTHLHHVFKKIKVRNRLQALMWAKKYKFNGAV